VSTTVCRHSIRFRSNRCGQICVAEPSKKASIGGADPRCRSRVEQIGITEIKIEKGAILSHMHTVHIPFYSLRSIIYPLLYYRTNGHHDIHHFPAFLYVIKLVYHYKQPLYNRHLQHAISTGLAPASIQCTSCCHALQAITHPASQSSETAVSDVCQIVSWKVADNCHRKLGCTLTAVTAQPDHGVIRLK
jgi:hypothetical protein